MFKYVKHFLKPNVSTGERITSVDNYSLLKNEDVIYIENGYLISKNKINYYNCHQSIDDIQVLYFTCINNKGLLFIAGKHNSYIPIFSENFANTFEQLSIVLGFSKQLLPEFTSTTFCDRNLFIWARKNETNYTIIDSKTSTDIVEGYEIQNSQRTFISWDTTYDEVINLKEIAVCTPDNEDDLIKYTFTTPVRVGDVILNNFSFYDCHRKNIAVSSYFSYCENSDPCNKPYIELKNLLLNYKELNSLKLNKTEENEYILSTTIQTENQEFYLSNAYPASLDAGNMKVFFLVTNLKEYPESVIYPKHTQKLAISHCTTLDDSIYLDTQAYKENPNIYRIPTFIQEISHNKTFIWIDENNDEVGFSDDLYTHLIPRKEIEYFSLHSTISEGNILIYKLCVKLKSNDTLLDVLQSYSNSLILFEDQIKRDIPIPFKSHLDDYIF
ncbi:hypothetical protein [Myroides phaeus]|uniref:hypothetical protein n=1 Tax=Myroides phaeus TaxID=702745 RepID=UPI001303A4CA|nr:hypothetical protein [Myroides phaeus]